MDGITESNKRCPRLSQRPLLLNSTVKSNQAIGVMQIPMYSMLAHSRFDWMSTTVSWKA
jgi:hypothetical protein